MKDQEKKFQVKLWLSAVLVSLIAFVVIKLIWNDVNNSVLLVLLVGAFLINFTISMFRIKLQN